MALQVRDIISVVADLCEEKHLRVAVESSLKGGVITGIVAAIAGLIFGPKGFAIGGLVGGAASSMAMSGKFNSVAVILRNLPHEKKQQLCTKIKHAIRNIGPQEVATLAALLLSNPNIQEIALREVSNFLRSEYNLSILQ